MRSRYEILSDMLLVSREKKTKSSILYGANLSYFQVQEYCRLLLDKHLLCLIEVDGCARYKTTEKGDKFLDCFQKIQDFLRTDQNKK